MPIVTRSFNHLANTILNNILDNVVNHSNNTSNIKKYESSHTHDMGLGHLDHCFSATDGASASLGLGCCSICCDDIQFDKGRFVLECGHTFHAKCILTEFRHRNRCPMCRTEVKESSAHERSYIMPGSLRINSSILHDAADHFIHDLGNITFANVVHRMMLLSSEDQDLRSIQYPYIKRLLVQFATMFVRGIAFSIRDRDDEVVDPVPIDIVDNMMEVDGINGANGANGANNGANGANNGDSEYDAAISNPALDAAIAYHAMVTTDMNFDSSSSSSHSDNVGAALIRRSVALAEMGLQRSELSLRRARRLALRRQQLEEVQRLLQEALRERQQEQEQQQQRQQSPDVQATQTQNINIVISEQQPQQQRDGHRDGHRDGDRHGYDDDDDSVAPYGLEF